MLSGHYQGRVLSFISKMVQPKRILEVGTFTGYATLCLAEGLAEDGEIHTIEAEPASWKICLIHILSPQMWRKKIRLHFGSAEQIIAGLPYNDFDLAFIDADKKK